MGDGDSAQRRKSVTTWSVYLLRCADDTLYCGTTTDVERRLAMHNGILAGGAKYTRSRRPVRLLACIGGLDRSAALRLEKAVKRLPRARKLEAMVRAGGLTASGD